jgi:hypothetical protein
MKKLKERFKGSLQVAVGTHVALPAHHKMDTADGVRLSPDHVAPGARLFSSREELLQQLPKGGRVAEVGVALGDFTSKILETMSASKFFAIDLFDWHKLQTLWGKPTSSLFQGKEHEQFYRDRFSAEIESGSLTVLRGKSWDVLTTLPDQSLDFVYIDAAHDYESVRKDLAAAAPKVARGGALGLNDYVLYDVFHQQPYGVVQACNEFCQREDWAIIMMSLEPLMFCDVVLMRRGDVFLTRPEVV